MNTTAEIHRRRNYFIDKKFQSAFILKFCLLVMAGGLLTIGLVYFLASQATTVSIVDSRVVVRSAADFILPLLFQTVCVVIILVGLATIFVTLFFSHRIAGPMYRFKKVLENLEQGDFSRGFHIRDLDQLQALADSLNEVIAKNGEQLAGLKSSLGIIEKKVEELMGSGSDEQRGRLAELKTAFSEAKSKLDYFKTA